LLISLLKLPSSKTREGWSLKTVETEVNGDSKSTNENGLPWLVRWATRAGTIDLYHAMTANYFFLTVHYFNLCVYIVQKLGQAVVQGRLSVNVCLRYPLSLFIVFIAYPGKSRIPRELVDTVIVVNVEIAGEQGSG
jgi:hypothetical protein